MINKNIYNPRFLIFFLCVFVLSLFFGCTGMAATAEEYFSIGMAYFDLGKYEDAEKWLNRARQADRTMIASTYNLGRLAFERKRYEEAASHFENILRRDPDNVLALRAAAYTRIMTGEIEIAERHYSRLLLLVPESADSGYNHALVLYAMGRYSASEEVLEKYPIALQENKDVMLLYARSQAAQNKVEAIENFSAWLSVHSDPKARFEYARILEHYEYYARALEEYRKALTEISATSVDPKRTDIRFAIARVLLIADSASSEGITELQGAVDDGFDNIAEVEALLGKVSGTNRESVQNIINNMQKAVEVIEVIEQEVITENEIILEDYS
ncbi:MAG: tetratricopeptide repeat protein [Treponema sp.]|nr:tetratricopeptide repeat protein [Treponema sp.]